MSCVTNSAAACHDDHCHDFDEKDVCLELTDSENNNCCLWKDPGPSPGPSPPGPSPGPSHGWNCDTSTHKCKEAKDGTYSSQDMCNFFCATSKQKCADIEKGLQSLEQLAHKQGHESLGQMLATLPLPQKKEFCTGLKKVNHYITSQGQSGCIPEDIEQFCGFGGGGGLSGGAIAGIVIGSIAGVVLLVLLILYIRKHK